jgi:hypothetical protein
MARITSDTITRIEAYKLDLFSYDAIAFDIELSDGSIVSCCEEDKEWTSIKKAVESLPLTDSGWWDKVAFPAFCDNRLVIYDKNVTR